MVANGVETQADGSTAQLVEGADFYLEGEWVVFTEGFLRRRGYCCRSGCRHCPYGFTKEARDDGTTQEAD